MTAWRPFCTTWDSTKGLSWFCQCEHATGMTPRSHHIMLLTVSRAVSVSALRSTKNILTFTMSGKSRQATADVTVININTRCRLAIFEVSPAPKLLARSTHVSTVSRSLISRCAYPQDKSAIKMHEAKFKADANEAQLVAEAIAAAMSNQSLPDAKKRRHTAGARDEDAAQQFNADASVSSSICTGNSK